ncbi:hypothetical protein ACSDR0_46345 [Streptosporangium sp. G11]|uniref:hypothetical protein n=1 Tax=Streptosporangium sp. G11 TaxID=3436926 RepID=UPI003EB6F8C5
MPGSAIHSRNPGFYDAFISAGQTVLRWKFLHCYRNPHLHILTGHQLARRVGRPGPAAAFERTPVTFSSVADRIGATGVRERRVRAYSVERDAYAWWLAEEEWMRTPGKRHRTGAIAGQGRLILAGAPSHANRARYPRDHRGRADHQAARAHLRMQRDAAATRAPRPAAAA